MWIFRVIVATPLSLTELLANLFIAAVYIGDLQEVNVLRNVFHSHTNDAVKVNKLILPLGIVSTTLFLPLENYIVYFAADLTKDTDKNLRYKEAAVTQEVIRMNYTEYGAIGVTPTSDMLKEQETLCSRI